MKTHGIAVIGRVADGVQLFDGQTVKTRILRDELHRRYPNTQIICVDTYQYKKRFVSVIRDTICAFLKCEHIFVLLSRNGRRFLFPILTGLNSLFHRRMYHDVIGGALPDEVKARPALGKQLDRFEVNWVEFSAMKEALEQLGVTNAEVLPNFKRLNVLKADQLPCIEDSPFVLTMFSRVLKEKEMGQAAEAVSEINRRYGSIRVVLHIYGPVEPDYEEEFQTLLKIHSEAVFYKGCVPYEKSVEILRDSFLLLFPSTYQGEGLPGTIIDAFSAGVPVIATDWHFNAELMRSGETGYCYSWKEPKRLTELIDYAINHPTEINSMRPLCLAEAEKYTPDMVMEQICKRMNREGTDE